MAHQTHTLPWHALAANFAYAKKHHYNTGVPEIIPTNKAAQVKQLEHFCRVFQKTLREYAVTERNKYPSQTVLAATAKAWVTGNEGKRKVYDDDLVQEWQVANWDHGPYVMTDLQDIENWATSEMQGRALVDARPKEACDAAKVLLMTGSYVMQPLKERKRTEEERRHIETLLVLANKEGFDLKRLGNMSEACCNTNCGVSSVAEKALKAYLYLNLLFAMREDGSEVCGLTDSTLRPNVDVVSWAYRKYECPKLRAKYMVTTAWSRLMYELVRDHKNHPEIAMYEPFFFPKNEDGRMVEADIMADAALTREFVRDLWKIMVNFDMIWREMGVDVDWEYMCIDALDEMFSLGSKSRSRLFGMYSYEWKDKRAESRSKPD